MAVVWRAICVSVPSRGFGSDDNRPARRAVTQLPVSVPSRGFGSDDPDSRARPCPTMRVSVPSRGFGSDDYLIEAGKLRAVRFPSPLGVLGLTTSDLPDCQGRCWCAFPSPLGVLGLTTRIGYPRRFTGHRRVSVPSRGFGSDDNRPARRAVTQLPVSVPSRGFGSDDSENSWSTNCRRNVSVPSRGFGSDDTGRGALTATAHMFPSPLGVLGLTTRE
ncbi:hypothetical protein X134_04069 [Mycobacterium tuberculosis BTB08-148]|nr:hypothetical protein X134_04069 [Mycobacterium tuberculosis BTB08-148]